MPGRVFTSPHFKQSWTDLCCLHFFHVVMKWEFHLALALHCKKIVSGRDVTASCIMCILSAWQLTGCISPLISLRSHVLSGPRAINRDWDICIESNHCDNKTCNKCYSRSLILWAQVENFQCLDPKSFETDGDLYSLCKTPSWDAVFYVIHIRFTCITNTLIELQEQGTCSLI